MTMGIARRLVFILPALLLGLFLLMPSFELPRPGGASTATTPDPLLVATPQTVPAGASTSLAGSGFGGRSTGFIALDGITVAAFRADEEGAFTLSLTVPARTEIGPHHVVARTSSASASLQLLVTPAPARPASAPNPAAAPRSSAIASPATRARSGAGARPTARPRSTAPLALGAYIPGTEWDPAKIDEFARLVGAMPAVVMLFQDWADPYNSDFSPARMDAIVSRGAMPLITWEPWNYADPGPNPADQPAFALRTILAGDHDAYIRRYARDAAAWNRPFYLRFAHEMNGDWASWSPGVNGNTSAEFVAAWRHVVDIFRREGANNIRWVWSPNVGPYSSTPFAQVYPGDDYVDWVALDGYNWGDSQFGAGWESLAAVFADSYDTLAELTDKPMMIAETGTTELGGSKADWITQGLLVEIPSHFPRIRAVVWFNVDKDADWPVDSSAAALAAYRQVVASPLYQGRLP